MSGNSIDFVGDVAGNEEALRDLLDGLGYREREGMRRNRGRRLVFLGGYLGGPDGGLAVLGTVAALRASGDAVALMGRGELDLVLGAAPEAVGAPGKAQALRGEGRRRHGALVASLGGHGSPGHREALGFCATLPMWFEASGLVAAHAYPGGARDPALAGCVDREGVLTLDGLAAASRPGAARAALTRLVDGPRVRLPGGLTVWDGMSKRPEALRKWWEPEPATWRAAVVGCPLDMPYDGPARDPRPPGVAVFGRYVEGAPTDVAAGDRACLAGRGPGEVVAYRWDGEAGLVGKKVTRAARVGTRGA